MDEKKDGVTEEAGREVTSSAPDKNTVPGKYLLRLIIVLTAVCTVVAALLASVNAVTRDKIASHKLEAQKAAVFEVFPGGDDCKLYESEDVDGDVYLVFRNGALCGYAARVLPSGFGGEIEMMVGVGADGKTTGVSIISLSETPGVGSKVRGESFLTQFRGTGKDVKVGGGIDGITGATISSKAVTEGVRMAHAIGVDLEKVAEELGVPLDRVGPGPEETKKPEPVPETETEAANETEPEQTAAGTVTEEESSEEPFTENGGPSGGYLPVDVGETDDDYQIEIDREAYSSMLEETDEPETTAAPTPAPTGTTAPQPTPTGKTETKEPEPEPTETESEAPPTESESESEPPVTEEESTEEEPVSPGESDIPAEPTE